MKTITLKIEDGVNDRFMSLLKDFSDHELRILEESEYVSDDDYLRSIEGMVGSINRAREEAVEHGVTLDKLDW